MYVIEIEVQNCQAALEYAYKMSLIITVTGVENKKIGLKAS